WAGHRRARRPRAHRLPLAKHRLRLSELQPPARAHGVRERRVPPASPRHARFGTPRSDDGDARVGRPHRQARSPAKPTERRTEAAGAIARALVKKPAVVLADEATANLDSHTGAEIIALMRQVQEQHAVSFAFSTHDPRLIS